MHAVQNRSLPPIRNNMESTNNNTPVQDATFVFDEQLSDEDRILRAITNEPQTANQIAEKVYGVGTEKRVVNPHLYRLAARGKISNVGGKSPLWTLPQLVTPAAISGRVPAMPVQSYGPSPSSSSQSWQPTPPPLATPSFGCYYPSPMTHENSWGPMRRFDLNPAALQNGIPASLIPQDFFTTPGLIDSSNSSNLADPPVPINRQVMESGMFVDYSPATVEVPLQRGYSAFCYGPTVGTMENAMRGALLPQPSQTTFLPSPSQPPLRGKPNREKLIEYLSTHPHSKPIEVAKFFGCERREANSALYDLQRENVAMRHVNDKGGDPRWSLV